MNALQRIAITGIGGYVGTRLMRILQTQDSCRRIVGIDLKEPRGMGDKTVYYRMDVRDPAVKNVFKDEKVTSVVHLAFVLNPIHNEFLMRDINRRGTENILHALRASHVKRLVYFSSATAYGAWKDNPVPLREDSALRGNPDFEYGHDKALVEGLMSEFSRRNPDVRITIFRPCIILGPNVDNYIASALTQKVGMLPFTANPPIQFVHEDDVVNAVVAALRKNAEGVFNIAGDGTLTPKECSVLAGGTVLRMPAFLVYLLGHIVWDLRLPVLRTPPSVIEYLTCPWIVDTTRMKKVLGYTPKYSSKETFIEFLRAKEEQRRQR